MIRTSAAEMVRRTPGAATSPVMAPLATWKAWLMAGDRVSESQPEAALLTARLLFPVANFGRGDGDDGDAGVSGLASVLAVAEIAAAVLDHNCFERTR
jgi:hypothetical protein